MAACALAFLLGGKLVPIAGAPTVDELVALLEELAVCPADEVSPARSPRHRQLADFDNNRKRIHLLLNHPHQIYFHVTEILCQVAKIH